MAAQSREFLVVLASALLLAGFASQARFQSESPRVYRPEGTDPFPATVLLPTCAGVRPHVLNWAEWLKAQGYVALVVNSPDTDVCRTGVNPSVAEVTEDAFAALTHLRSLPFVDPGRIAVIGWSYGGVAALYASERAPGGFRAAVGFYPSAPRLKRIGLSFRNHVPLLLLLGEADESGAQRVLSQAKSLQQEGLPVSVDSEKYLRAFLAEHLPRAR